MSIDDYKRERLRLKQVYNDLCTLQMSGMYDAIDSLLKQWLIERDTLSVLCLALIITASCKGKLPHRRAFYDAVRVDFIATYGEQEAARLLAGLE